MHQMHPQLTMFSTYMGLLEYYPVVPDSVQCLTQSFSTLLSYENARHFKEKHLVLPYYESSITARTSLPGSREEPGRRGDATGQSRASLPGRPPLW